ncbi:MAG: beta-galactosidase [Acidobacterium ailaaui]|nr:beta-galactosidase [Pseudacidobacterium ailaaui]
MKKLLFCLGLWLAYSPFAIPQQTAPEGPAADTSSLLTGVAWYPEQWPESRWETDLSLMEAAHIHLVRIGEFAWSRIEPQEGSYDLDWMDRAIALAAKHHIVTVIGTPTDAPPAWMTQRYPDILRVNLNGQRDEHGNRRQFSYTSPRYLAFCRKVVEQLGRRFGHNPNVIGWQIGNEFSFDSYDRYTKKLFQQWLRDKYKTLSALNQHWTTAYWSQTYTAWEQIPLEDTRGNPGLLLDHRRFVSDVWLHFENNQIDVLRAQIAPWQFITTNIGGLAWSDRWDHYTIAHPLDLASWDDYVGQGQVDPYKDGAMHDLIRGLKQKNFWVMEAQPGFVNWAPINNALDRGEVRRMAWAAVGHGADAICYWQWRSALNGQEQYHGALLGADGTPNPLYTEIQQIGEEFHRLGPELYGTTPQSEVAILHDYDSRWAIDFEPHTARYDQLQVLLDFYRPLRDQAQSVDIVPPDADLDRYKLVVAPSLNVIPDKLGQHLLRYVQHGGHLVLGPRSGMKDAFNALDVHRQPGPLVAPLGGRVEQYYALEGPVPVSGTWGTATADIWAEALSTRDPQTRVLMRYGKSNGWLDGQPAAITRQLGQGSITYLGTLLDASAMNAAIRWMLHGSGVHPVFGPLPHGVEVCRRTRPGHTIFILINENQTPVTVPLPHPMKDLLHAGPSSARVVLPVHGVAVLESNP